MNTPQARNKRTNFFTAFFNVEAMRHGVRP